MYVHSVRIELPKSILVGTRITYQGTGDAVISVYKIINTSYQKLHFTFW